MFRENPTSAIEPTVSNMLTNRPRFRLSSLEAIMPKTIWKMEEKKLIDVMSNAISFTPMSNFRMKKGASGLRKETKKSLMKCDATARRFMRAHLRALKVYWLLTP
ncbi:MAG: hypothetical protein XD58_1114 [Thermotoga sp. 50_1627]|nr:MAG: hypothetical protein XD45_0708 [Thermotoga sp. 50_64]KUK24902.1 MAG: hypothetical protein XD58_1114 [Thermotoga sp. 50_1627]